VLAVFLDFLTSLGYANNMDSEKQVRFIQTNAEEEAFRKTTVYCFNDPIGWSDRIFPLTFGDKAWGVFNNGILETGLITRNYEARVFSDWKPMSGISFVQTPPEYRNGENVSLLFTRVLSSEKNDGKLFSCLYPFKFGYYEKYGYGYSGGPNLVSFPPENINVRNPGGCEYVPFGETQNELNAMTDVYEKWVTGFSFGIKPRQPDLDWFCNELAWSKDRIILLYDRTRCTGFLRMHKIIVSQFISHLEIKKIAWTDERSFLGLMAFIGSHRDQIKEVRWSMPQSVPVWLVMKNPRIQVNRLFDWMARPLNIQALVALKAENLTCNSDIIFSVKDDIISDNTGTFRINGNTVTNDEYDARYDLPLPLLSSLLFGGYSLEQAKLCGKPVPESLLKSENFFNENRVSYVSEFF
jgi:predicted acetyltransferase